MKGTAKQHKEGSRVGDDRSTKNGLDSEKMGVNVSDMEEQMAALVSDLQRTRADFENFRKQVEIQKNNEKKATKLATVYKFLPVLDDIDRAIAMYEELKPIEGSLKKTMKELGLVKIEMNKGVEFDPGLAEAVMADGEGEKEVVSEVLRPGYYYEGEVLRPAMVKVEKI